MEKKIDAHRIHVTEPQCINGEDVGYQKLIHVYNRQEMADRLELLCTFLDNNTNLKRALEYNSNLPQNYFYYYETLGTKILKACMYREDNILQRINILKAENKIRELVFKLGMK